MRPDAICVIVSSSRRHKSQIMLPKIKRRSDEGHLRVLTFLWSAPRDTMINDGWMRPATMSMVMNHRHCDQLAAFVLFPLGDSV
jgi:hypothetical protein